MAKKQKKKRFWPFLLGMLIYALIFLGATAWGLGEFWDYIEAYELSRPETAINDYMGQVDVDYLCDGGVDAVAAMVDPGIQSEAACREYMAGTLSGDIRHAKKLSECTDERMVYMVLCGDRAICKVTLTPQPADEYGFTPWQVTEEDFDFSYIHTDTARITVPYNYPAYIGDARLDDSYIIESDIHFEAVESLYDTYSPPYMVTYESGPFLGDLEFIVTDPAGVPVVIDEDTDMSRFLSNCTPEETAQLNTLVEGFVHRYVDFTSNANNALQQNYDGLRALVMPGCELATRLYHAMDGLSWTRDRQADVTQLTVNHYVSIGQDRYLCDVHYEVDTVLHDGLSHEITNVQFIIAATENGLLVESMNIY